MNPESEDRAWRALQARAQAQLRPGFADCVLRAARTASEAAPSLMGSLMLSAATATLCFLAVAAVHSAQVRVQTDRNLANWQSIASANDDLAP